MTVRALPCSAIARASVAVAAVLAAAWPSPRAADAAPDGIDPTSPYELPPAEIELVSPYEGSPGGIDPTSPYERVPVGIELVSPYEGSPGGIDPASPYGWAPARIELVSPYEGPPGGIELISPYSSPLEPELSPGAPAPQDRRPGAAPPAARPGPRK